MMDGCRLFKGPKYRIGDNFLGGYTEGWNYSRVGSVSLSSFGIVSNL